MPSHSDLAQVVYQQLEEARSAKDWGAAVEHATQLTRIYDRLLDAGHRYAEEIADAFLALSEAQRARGQLDEAIAAARETVNYFKACTTTEPELFEARLGHASSYLSSVLSQAGRVDEALTYAGLATVAFRRRVMAGRRLEPQLAATLNNYANLLSDAGKHAAALAAIDEALEHYAAQAAGGDPEALSDVAMARLNRGAIFGELGRHDKSDEEYAAAAEDYRALAEHDPRAYGPYLAVALSNRSEALATLGDVEAAHAASREAIGMLRVHYLRDKDTLGPWMDDVRRNYLRYCELAGMRPEADLLAE